MTLIGGLIIIWVLAFVVAYGLYAEGLSPNDPSKWPEHWRKKRGRSRKRPKKTKTKKR